MATHRRKVVEVEAHKWEGSEGSSTLNVYHEVKGHQTAKKGDWLVGSERGKIEVVKAEDFCRDFEDIPTADATLDEDVIGNADGGYDITHTETEE
jgi:hypothetical protein